MDLRRLARYSNRMLHIMEGTLDWEMNHGIDALVENEDWELMSVMLLTAAEVPARRMAERLVAADQIFHLVLPACFRRQIRKAEVIDSSGFRRRLFRDIDSIDMDDEAGIPEHIKEMAEEISETSDRTRMIALQRELQEDNDGVRPFIVEAVAQKLTGSADAVNALVLIACCSIFEDTRRLAALKIANHQPTVRKLATAGRANELVQIAHASGMESVAATIAQALTELIPDLKQNGNARALEFVADNHPDVDVRNSAREALPPERPQQ